MSVTVKIEIDTAAPRELLEKLAFEPAELRAINERIAAHGQDTTQIYLTQMAASRHDTARSLGAEPTGFWGEAAEHVSQHADETAAHVGIASPGIFRATQDIDILPGPGKTYLTLPRHPIAYGKRAREVARMIPLFPLRTGPGGVGVLATREPGKKTATVIYLLVPSVHQQRDPTLLPNDEDYIDAAREGFLDWVDAELGE